MLIWVPNRIPIYQCVINCNDSRHYSSKNERTPKQSVHDMRHHEHIAGGEHSLFHVDCWADVVRLSIMTKPRDITGHFMTLDIEWRKRKARAVRPLPLAKVSSWAPCYAHSSSDSRFSNYPGDTCSNRGRLCAFYRRNEEDVRDVFWQLWQVYTHCTMHRNADGRKAAWQYSRPK